MRLGRSSVAGLVALAAALVVTSSVRGSEPPRLSIDGRGSLVIASLPPILADAEVKRHLDSGLTASLVFQVRSAAVEMGGARLDIRLELWDELYLVTIIDGRGRVEKTEFDSRQALEQWWAQLELMLSATVKTPHGGFPAKISLAVVPFSQAELVDTQKWLAESIGQAQGGSATGRLGGGSRAVSALIATSMQRRAVRSWRWNLSVEQRDPH